jgi:hypothetical protein
MFRQNYHHNDTESLLLPILQIQPHLFFVQSMERFPCRVCEPEVRGLRGVVGKMVTRGRGLDGQSSTDGEGCRRARGEIGRVDD